MDPVYHQRWDRLDSMMRAQSEQQRAIHGGDPLGADQRRDLGIQLATLLGGEVYDYLDALGYKQHLPPVERSREDRIYEVVDLLKYVLALAWVEQIDPQELHRAFTHKTEIVRERERRIEADRRIAAIDIDGVLADISQGGYDSSWTIEEQDEWMRSGKLMQLLPLRESVDALNRLRLRGWSIVLVTSRKRHRHKIIEQQTYAWLNMHGIPYDKVLWGHDKVETMIEAGMTPAFYIDDSLKHALDVAEWGVKTYLMGETDADFTHPYMRKIASLLDIDELSGECRESMEDEAYAQTS